MDNQHITFKVFDSFEDFDLVERNKLIALCQQVFLDFNLEKFERKIKDFEKLHLILARQGEEWIGFKLGYEKSPALFYSWLGGVAPKHRKKGLAKALMEGQHQWCRQQGYERVQTKTMNAYKAMLILNIKAGFDIIDTYQKEGQPRKILLEKQL